MTRPGLKRLLAEIEAGSVDAIVVYKVDRLTWSLADFARILEALDKRGVGFIIATRRITSGERNSETGLSIGPWPRR